MIPPRSKILIQLTACSYGGVETHVYYLSLLLAEAGAEVTLISQRKFDLNAEWTSHLRDAGVRILSPPFWTRRLKGPLGLIPARIGLAHDLGEAKFDVVIGQGHGGSFAWLRRFVKPEGLCLWHEHWYGVSTRGRHFGPHLYEIPPRRLSFRMRRMIRKMDGILTGCELARRNLIHIQKVKKPIRIIPPLDRLLNVPKVMDRDYSPLSTLKLAMFGRLEPNKGIEPLLNLWEHIHIGDAELHLYGVELEQTFRFLAQQLGLSNVVFHGSFERSDLPKLLDKVDIGLMLSFGEGYGLVPCEYMACGVPFVMTDVGAAWEFTNGNRDALKVACDNRAVKEGIEEMAGRVRSGCTSRQRLQAFHQHNFSYEKAAALYLKALLEPQTFWGCSPEPAAAGSPEIQGNCVANM